MAESGVVGVLSSFCNDLLNKEYLWIILVLLIAVVVVAIVIHMATVKRVDALSVQASAAVQPSLLMQTSRLHDRAMLKRLMNCARRAEASRTSLSAELSRELEIDELIDNGREGDAAQIAAVARSAPHAPLPQPNAPRIVPHPRETDDEDV